MAEDTTSESSGTEEQSAETQAEGNGSKQGAGSPFDMFGNPLFIIVLAVWGWVLWSSRKQKKKRAEEKEKLDSAKKGDRIVTIGRLYGTVVAASEETVTIKPDEKSNATLTFDRVAIHKILPRGGDKTESGEDENKS